MAIYFRNFFLSILFVLILLISGYSQSENITEELVSVMQKKTNLLAGQVKAVAYSGFRHGQHPDRGDGVNNPNDEEILEDLQILTHNSNFSLIRLYDSQKNSQDVLRVIKENNLNMKVMLGVWLYAEISNHEGCPWLNEPIPQAVLDSNKIKNKIELNNGIRLCNNYPEIVIAVNVGNEALVSWTDHLVAQDSVISYVKKVKNTATQLVTVAENHKWWTDHGSALANELDFISVHSYPLWDGKDIEEAMTVTINDVNNVIQSIPGKRVVISEAGWATVANEFGDRASEEKQKRYYRELLKWASEMNITTFFFEAFDEDWKGNPDNPMGAEKHWGLFTVDRKAKMVMHELYPDIAPGIKKD